MAINIHNHVNMFSRIKKGKRPLYIYVALLFVWQNYEIQLYNGIKLWFEIKILSLYIIVLHFIMYRFHQCLVPAKSPHYRYHQDDNIAIKVHVHVT